MSLVLLGTRLNLLDHFIIRYDALVSCMAGEPSTTRISAVFRRACKKFKLLSRKRRNAVAVVPIANISLSVVVQLVMPHLSAWQPPQVSGEPLNTVADAGVYGHTAYHKYLTRHRT